VPKGVAGGNSALSLTGVEVGSIDNILVGLGVSGKLRCELVDRLGKISSNMERLGGVQEGEGDEEFLPEEGVQNLHYHTTGLVDDVLLLGMSELNVSGGQAESGEVLEDNEIRIVLGNEELGQR